MYQVCRSILLRKKFVNNFDLHVIASFSFSYEVMIYKQNCELFQFKYLYILSSSIRLVTRKINNFNLCILSSSFCFVALRK